MMKVQTELKPRNDMVLCRLDAPKEKTDSGIYLPPGTRMSTATVVAVGPGAKTDNVPGFRMPMDLDVGAKVYLAGDKFSLTYIDGDDSLVLVPEQLIVAVVL